MLLDIARIAPTETLIGRKVRMSVKPNTVVMYMPPSHKWGGGRESKKITVNRSLLLDNLFFEGLGLWVGEGGKNKGLYFGNTESALLLCFLKFVEEKLGLNRREFKVTLNTPQSEMDPKEKWSRSLGVPLENFTDVCHDTRINEEYAQLYFNSIILAELMRNLQEKLRPVILSTKEYAAPFLKGMFAAE